MSVFFFSGIADRVWRIYLGVVSKILEIDSKKLTGLKLIDSNIVGSDNMSAVLKYISD